MPETETNYLNTGIYSVAEATKLTGVSAGRIRRWLRGYRFKSKTKTYSSPPLWSGQLEPIGHKLALGFLDLIETTKRAKRGSSFIVSANGKIEG